jgi:CDGSH-type Zn-finger protein
MSSTPTEKRKPMIVTTKYSNYLVTDLETLKKADGTSLKTEPVTALCRCGHSKYKPFCDGTHNEKGGHNEVKKKDRLEDRVKTYEGNNITIYDNRGVCSHDESCTRLLPAVFDKDKRPWIDPDGASVAEIIDTIEKCPSGALSYGIGSRRYQELDREPAIQTTKDGPLKITGGIILKDDQGCQPECREHYTLCRCGESKNKPFCDGSHDAHDFKAD